MNTTLKWIIGIIIVILIGWLVTDSNKDISQGDQEIRIGGLFGLTGFASFAGEASRNGFLMAIEDSGMDVDYVIEDFQSDFTATVSAARKLIDVNDVDVVVGPEWNQFAELIAPIADEEQVVFISPWETSESEWSKAKYYFSGMPSERSQIKFFVEYLSENNLENVALIYSNNAWANGVVDIFKDELANVSSLKIVSESKKDTDILDYRTEVAKIKASNPDAIYTVMATDGDQGVLLKQLAEQGVTQPIFTPHSYTSNPAFVEEYSPYTTGVAYHIPKEQEKIEEFNRKYEERFGGEPGAVSAAVAYDMTTLVLEAIKDGATTANDVRKYLLDVEGYEGYSNTITFNKYGKVAAEDVEIRRITETGTEVIK